MEWQQIIGFYKLVEHGSFTRAAESSYRTQSAVSQQIRKLEKELQCDLIDRGNRKKVILTPEGERLFQYAKSVIDGRERLLDDLKILKGVPAGRLKIAAPFTTLYHLFPPGLKRYVQNFPHVKLTILDRPGSAIAELLKNDEIDIGVLLESAAPKNCVSTRWKAVDPFLIVPAKHPLLKTRNIQLKHIAQYPLILPPRSHEHAGRILLEDSFLREGLEYRVIMESANVELSSRYVELGLGISFATLARGLKVLNGRKLNLIQLDKYIESDHVSLAVRKGKSMSGYVTEFIEYLITS